QRVEILSPIGQAYALAAGGAGRFEDSATDMLTKPAIALELRLREPLVERGVVGKRRVLLFVAQDINGLVARDRCLDVHHGPRFVGAGILDRPNYGMARAVDGVLDAFERSQIEADLCAEIGAALADRHRDAGHLQLSVLFAVADDDVAAPAAHQLV